MMVDYGHREAEQLRESARSVALAVGLASSRGPLRDAILRRARSTSFRSAGSGGHGSGGSGPLRAADRKGRAHTFRPSTLSMATTSKSQAAAAAPAPKTARISRLRPLSTRALHLSPSDQTIARGKVAGEPAGPSPSPAPAPEPLIPADREVSGICIEPEEPHAPGAAPAPAPLPPPLPPLPASDAEGPTIASGAGAPARAVGAVLPAAAAGARRGSNVPSIPVGLLGLGHEAPPPPQAASSSHGQPAVAAGRQPSFSRGHSHSHSHKTPTATPQHGAGSKLRRLQTYLGNGHGSHNSRADSRSNSIGGGDRDADRFFAEIGVLREEVAHIAGEQRALRSMLAEALAAIRGLAAERERGRERGGHAHGRRHSQPAVLQSGPASALAVGAPAAVVFAAPPAAAAAAVRALAPRRASNSAADVDVDGTIDIDAEPRTAVATGAAVRVPGTVLSDSS
eukprot:tig00000042_g15538.t1